MGVRNRALLVLAGLLVGLACWYWLGLPDDLQGEVAPEPPPMVRLGLAMQPTSALAIIATELGLFEQAGLMVEVRRFPSGKRALNQGLRDGDMDVVVSADIPVMLGALNMPDLRILATIGSTSDVNRLVARRDRGIAGVADLRGKRIATQEASAVHYFMHRLLEASGIADADVQRVYLPAEELVPALLAGRADAMSMREPYVSAAVAGLGDQALVVAAPGLYAQSDMLVVRRAFVNERPAVVRGLLRALLAAEDFVRARPDEARQLLARQLQADPDHWAEVWAGLDLHVGLDQALLVLLETQARWALREGFVESMSPAGLRAHLYPEALAQVRPQAVTISR